MLDTSLFEIKYLYRVVFYSFRDYDIWQTSILFSGSEISRWEDVFEMIGHSAVRAYYSGHAKLKLFLYLKNKK